MVVAVVLVVAGRRGLAMCDSTTTPIWGWGFESRSVVRRGPGDGPRSRPTNCVPVETPYPAHSEIPKLGSSAACARRRRVAGRGYDCFAAPPPPVHVCPLRCVRGPGRGSPVQSHDSWEYSSRPGCILVVTVVVFRSRSLFPDRPSRLFSVVVAGARTTDP